MHDDLEYFDIIDESGSVIGKALRSDCHGNPSLIHRTVHVIVYHPDGRMLLQKRNQDKDIQPGKWDTAVGGHLDLGEDYSDAVIRELSEELGVFLKFEELKYVMSAKIRNEIESENVKVYSIVYSGPFNYQRDEIQEIKFWTICELRKGIKNTPEIFTPNFIQEFKELDEE